MQARIVQHSRPCGVPQRRPQRALVVRVQATVPPTVSSWEAALRAAERAAKASSAPAASAGFYSLMVDEFTKEIDRQNKERQEGSAAAQLLKDAKEGAELAAHVGFVPAFTYLRSRYYAGGYIFTYLATADRTLTHGTLTNRKFIMDMGQAAAITYFKGIFCADGEYELRFSRVDPPLPEDIWGRIFDFELAVEIGECLIMQKLESDPAKRDT